MKGMGRRWGKEGSRRGWEDSLKGGKVGLERGYSSFELLVFFIELILNEDVLVLPKLLLFVFHKFISRISPKSNALKLHHSHFLAILLPSMSLLTRVDNIESRVAMTIHDRQ